MAIGRCSVSCLCGYDGDLVPGAMMGVIICKPAEYV
jgi:hypothetical protein